MSRFDFYAILVLLLWISYDLRQIQKELKAIREKLDSQAED
jgi:hypothetical protein